jgi:hypothetical protein
VKRYPVGIAALIVVPAPGSLSMCRSPPAWAALAHRLQAEVAGELAGRVEADAVVADRQGKAAIHVRQGDAHGRCLGVLDGVVRRLLGDAANPAGEGFGSPPLRFCG